MEALASDLITFAEGAFKGSLLKAPEATYLIWDCFCQLSMARTGNGFGPNPISHSEILSWSLLHRTRLTEWDLSVIRRLDVLFLRNTYQKDENQARAMDGKEFADSLRAMSKKDKGVGR